MVRILDVSPRQAILNVLLLSGGGYNRSLFDKQTGPLGQAKGSCFVLMG